MAFDVESARYAVTEALRLNFIDMVAQTRLIEAKLLMALQKKSISQKLIKWDVDLGGDTASILAATADRAQNDSTIIAPASLPIGDYKISHSFQLLKTDIAQALATGNPADLTNAVQYKLRQAYSRIMRDYNTLLFTGDGSNGDGQVNGLAKITEQPDAVTGITTYAGIAHNDGTATTAANPEWVSVYNPVIGAFDEADLLRTERLIEEREATYDLLVMSPLTAETYRTQFTSLREFRNTSDVMLGVAPNMSYSDRPVLVDNTCPDDVVYFINTMELCPYGFRVQDAVDVNGLPFFISPIATQNALLLEWEVGILPQLWAFQRKSVAVMQYGLEA